MLMLQGPEFNILLETYVSLTGPNNDFHGNKVPKHGPNNTGMM